MSHSRQFVATSGTQTRHLVVQLFHEHTNTNTNERGDLFVAGH